jgi:uncharacterized Fe-S cluster-containing radical SAM superfamily protein
MRTTIKLLIPDSRGDQVRVECAEDALTNCKIREFVDLCEPYFYIAQAPLQYSSSESV